MGKHHDYSTGDVLSAGFLDALNEFLSTQVANFRVVKATATSIKVVQADGSSDPAAGVGQAAIGFGGPWRYVSAAVSANTPGGLGAGTHDIYVTSQANDNTAEDAGTFNYAFGLKLLASGGTPSGAGAEAIYRKVGTFDWDGAQITAVHQTVGQPDLTQLQPLDSDLTAIAALATTGYGRGLLAVADAAALRTAGGLVIGTNVQAWDADLDAVAALATTAIGRSLLAIADAAAGRTILGVTPATYSTTAPASPAEGDEWYYPADATNGIIWHFRWRATPAKWEFVGGPPLVSLIETAESRAGGSSGTYANLTTVGPSLTTPLAGDYFVQIGMEALSSTGSSSGPIMSYDIGATAAVDADAEFHGAPVANGYITGVAPPRRKTLAAATALVAKYKNANSANDFTARKRWMSLLPVRI